MCECRWAGQERHGSPAYQPHTIACAKKCTSAVGVLLEEGAPGDLGELQGLVDVLVQTAVALCATLHTLTHQAGQSLREDLKQSAVKVSTGCTALVQAVGGGIGGVKRAVGVWCGTGLAVRLFRQRLQQGCWVRQLHACWFGASAAAPWALCCCFTIESLIHTGGVWDACDSLNKLQLDNRSALFRRLSGALRAGKDALREVGVLFLCAVGVGFDCAHAAWKQWLSITSHLSTLRCRWRS